MEKGLKTLQAAARTAQRRASATQMGSFEERGISDHNSDSGIGLGSDTEMEVGDTLPGHIKSASWHAHTNAQQQTLQQPEHVRSLSLPQPLPLYQPPPPVTQIRRTLESDEMMESPQTMTFGGRPAMGFSRYSPDSNGRGGYSIQSMLSPAEPPCA